ncbi:hypothetical protein [Halobacillus litoralis]|uniref:Nitroreductase domain-containing protein n=1 Tax=Halobacillus litoralis TaxID=45668 RepID=A0A410MBW4_9BACI|nr:hypothetical protein [Halobacillus litoralis]QAS52234.1 hypothetical protein HLI_08320 [Halobacillus litoralis]
MLDEHYLNTYGEQRFETFSFGLPVEEKPIMERPVAYIDMDFLKRHNSLNEWDSFLYKVFSSVERVYRIDFHSKYFFHTTSPTAKNFLSIHLVLAHKGYLYKLNPMTDKIEVSENTWIKGVEPEGMYLALVSDDRKLQLDYGGFYKMLSRLNVGHAKMNVEAVLESESIPYHEMREGDLYMDEHIDFVEVGLCFRISLARQNNMKPIKRFLLDPVHGFQQRTSSQTHSGDAFPPFPLDSFHMKCLVDEVNGLEQKHNIKVACFINDAEEYERGYYHWANGEFIKVDQTCQPLEYQNILKEYHAFTNLTSMNIWLFFYFDRNMGSFNRTFMDIGYAGQYISLLVSSWGRTARGMKNYDDLHLKKCLGLTTDDFIGYSVMIAPHPRSLQSSVLNL